MFPGSGPAGPLSGPEMPEDACFPRAQKTIIPHLFETRLTGSAPFPILPAMPEINPWRRVFGQQPGPAEGFLQHEGEGFVDAYKKFILIGAVALGAGYFLPWLADAGQGVNGWDLLKVGYEYLTYLMDMEPFDWGQVDISQVLFYAAITLPLLGGLLSLLYCLLRPAGGNGFLGTFFFLLPVLVVAAVYGFVFLYRNKPSMAGMIAKSISDSVTMSAFDLTKTGGLWLVHLGAVLMLLARLARGGDQRRM